MRFVDLTGQKFGRLRVLRRVQDDTNKNRRWLCQCDCGNQKIVGGRHLTSGAQVSCGCYRKELKTNLKHGMRHTRIYAIWSHMKHRCRHHPDYAGRDITVCKEWEESFEAFYEWARANGYSDTLTLDRIDNQGNYEPENCRWATPKQQGNNRRSTRLVTYDGFTMSIAQHCRRLELNRNTVRTRISRGWTIEEAFNGKRKPEMQDIPSRQ